MSSPDLVLAYAASLYPRPVTLQSTATRFGLTTALAQGLLDGLQRQGKVLRTDNAPSSNPSYLEGTPERIRRELVAAGAPGRTSSTLAVALRLTPTLVASDLERLVLLSLATRTTPREGEPVYVSTQLG
jgi:hypothetical protein